MSLLGNLFRSSIGRKFLMAITGFILLGFVTGHLVGNLQIFAHPDHINGYAHFLQSLGPVLWLVRLVLLATVGIHVWAAVTLMLENKAARGGEAYGVNKWLRASVASRYMRLTGIVILAFIVYHILHFTVGSVQTETFKTNFSEGGKAFEYVMTEDFREIGLPLCDKGTAVHDVWSMIYLGFKCPWVSIFYIVSVGLLSFHLWHGISSMFQTIGWLNEKWSCCLGKLAGVFALVYFLASAAIPGAILAGCVKPAPGTFAAKVCATDACCPVTTPANK